MFKPFSTIAVTLALVALSGTTYAASKAECVEAHTRAQQLKASGQFSAARRVANTCAQAECPDLVQADCAAYAEELRLTIPRVSFAAQARNGADLQDVSVEIDGVPVAATLADGKSYEVDPGHHTVRFVRDGEERIVSVVLAEGERSRVVRVTFGPADGTASPGADAAHGSGAGAGRAAAAPAPAASKTGPIAVTVVSAVALAGSGIVYGLGAAKHAALSSDLSKVDAGGVVTGTTQAAAEDAAATGKTLRTVGAVGAGIGLAGLAVGIAWWMAGPSRPSTASTQNLSVVSISPVRGGGLVSLSRSF